MPEWTGEFKSPSDTFQIAFSLFRHCFPVHLPAVVGDPDRPRAFPLASWNGP